jgi:serine/threonine protein kinase
MIGKILASDGKEYKIVERINEEDRPNAYVDICIDQNNQMFIAKHFYKQPPSANIALSKHNHYGRRRDGSLTVFNEIQTKNNLFPFLVKHIARINYLGKWVIILEHIQGEMLKEFIISNYKNNIELVVGAISELGKTLATWHANGFAHGDPHLDNVIVTQENNSLKTTLIDYCQIHHPDFVYCRQYECFTNPPDKRFKEDLVNHSGKLGYGYKSDLIGIDKNLNLSVSLAGIFEDSYLANLRNKI